MHNGQFGDWSLIRRQAEALIPDAFYRSRIGTTDSEAIFLAILGAGADDDPVGATMRTLGAVTDIVRASGTDEPVRFTAALTDGHDLYAFRYASNDTANTLYFRQAGTDVVVVSEPLDHDRDGWQPVPPGHMIVARDGRALVPEPFPHDRRLAAE
jgi:glutamine amidotransferase